MERTEILNRVSEKINELAESIRDEMDVSKAEEVYSAILISTTRQFKNLLSVREMAYNMNAISAHILMEAADEDTILRNMYPKMPDGFIPDNN